MPFLLLSRLDIRPYLLLVFRAAAGGCFNLRKLRRCSVVYVIVSRGELIGKTMGWVSTCSRRAQLWNRQASIFMDLTTLALRHGWRRLPRV
jgi:hypothetical protein